MASYKINSTRARVDQSVVLDVWVFPTGADTGDNGNAVGHFDVVLDAGEVKAAEGMTAQQRNVYLKALFEADARITGVIEAEEAKVLLDGCYSWPVVIQL